MINIDKNKGFIVLHRKMFEWEWYTDVNTCHLFLHCLLRANHETKKWQGKIIERGSFITSLAHLSAETGLTVQQVRTSLNKLKITNELTSKTTSRNTVITVNNYNSYQDYDKQNNNQATIKQQTNNNQATTNNNENNENKERKENTSYSLKEKNFSESVSAGTSKKKFVPPQLSAVESYCNERQNGIDPQKFVDFYEARGWMMNKTKMKDWKAAVRTWERQDKEQKAAAWQKTHDFY